jgi:hypothetical protein
MYLVQSEAEIPIQPMPNTSYYIIGKEVRIFDNAGQRATFVLPPKEPTQDEKQWINRLERCERKIDKVFQHLTSFVGDEVNE